jgi:hypothetical protein
VNDLPAESPTTAHVSEHPPGDVEPLDVPMVPFVAAGLAVWVIVGLGMVIMRGPLTRAGHGSWLWICLAGVLTGTLGLVAMVRHDAGRSGTRTAARAGHLTR